MTVSLTLYSHSRSFELTLLRSISRSRLQTSLAELRRAGNVCPEINLPHDLLNLAALGGAHVDLARDVRGCGLGF